MWQVSDHLQYLPLIAPVALAVAGLAVLLNRKIFKYTGAVLVLTFSILTFQRAQVFATEESLFRDTLAKNPAAANAHNDLGVILAKRQDYVGATDHFSTAVQTDPDHAGAQSNLGLVLAMSGNFAEAEPHFLAAIQIKPADPLAHQRFADALSHQGRFREAIAQLQVARCLSIKPDVQTRTGPGRAALSNRQRLCGGG